MVDEEPNMEKLKEILSLSEDQLRVFNIFHPYALRKIWNAVNKNLRFVHYTTADTGIKIIRSKEVWMRKSSCMNDFSEIQHGLDCLKFAYERNKNESEKLFDSMFPNFSAKLEQLFNQWIPDFEYNTYVACVSEHNTPEGKSEDVLGKLSMWRAYGGRAGVAIVMNGASFHAPTDALRLTQILLAILIARNLNFSINVSLMV